MAERPSRRFHAGTGPSPDALRAAPGPVTVRWIADAVLTAKAITDAQAGDPGPRRDMVPGSALGE
jgi:hypothetical protein